jgi:drug/metabolite transporter (DMT)-like permease
MAEATGQARATTQRSPWRGLGQRPGIAAALGAFCIAFSGILVRLAKVSPDTAAFFRCLYALPALGLLAWVERRRFGPRPFDQRGLALIAGVFFAADLLFWHRSIVAVGAGLATVLGNVQVVFVGLLAWAFLRERPDRRLFVAVPIVLAGIVLISGVLEDGAFGRDPVMGVVYGILTAITYSGFILILRQGNRDIRRPAGPLFDATLTATLVAWLVGWALGDLDLTPGPEAQGWLVTLALTSQVGGWLLISLSLPRLPAAMTSMIITLQPVASVFLAMLILDEAPSALQLGGVALVLAGVIVAARRRRPTVEGRPHAAPVVEPAG